MHQSFTIDVEVNRIPNEYGVGRAVITVGGGSLFTCRVAVGSGPRAYEDAADDALEKFAEALRGVIDCNSDT